MKAKGSEKTYTIVCVVITTLFGLLCLYPLLYIFGMSLVTKSEWDARNGLIFLFPSNPTFAAYSKVFKTGGYILQALWVSVYKTAIVTVVGVFLAAILGYVLSIKKLPGGGFFSGLVIFTIFFSGGMIPTYLVVSGLGITNTIWALILPAVLNTWYALICKQFFVGIPEEIVEAAKVDGISEFGLFVKIVLPMSTPVLASIGLFTMVGSWNNWFDAMLYLDVSVSHLWPLQYYVTVMFNNMAQISQGDLHDIMNIVGTDAQVADIATRMALTIISFVPILLIYPFFQKYFTKGVYMGSVK